MYQFIKNNQMDIMLLLSVSCFTFGLLLIITRFLDKRKKAILFGMEMIAAFLLYFDRAAYLYSGNITEKGYVMVRLSNFMVFFLTACIVLCFNFYVIYIFTVVAKQDSIPRRIAFVTIASLLEMLLIIINYFTGIIYYFDEANRYHRGPAFVICYIIPVLCPLIQFSAVYKNRKLISHYIYISIILYVFVPIIIGIVQIFAYGISIVNMSMALVSISLYVFTYLDINDTLVNVHEHEMQTLKEEQTRFKQLFNQTALAFMSAVEKRNELTEGHTVRVSNRVRRVAELMGKSEEDCDAIYYASLLHNVGLVSIPDKVLEATGEFSEEYKEIIEKVPVLSSEILSSIKGYPYINDAALFSHERYDGSGYPMKLAGQSIPEVARIIGAVDAYDAMTSKRSYRGALPIQTVREEFIKEAGIKYDPDVALTIVRTIDEDGIKAGGQEILPVEEELSCGKYREHVSVGIPVTDQVSRITFDFEENNSGDGIFSEPAILLFDSFDQQVHDDPKTVEAYHYMEYGEIWFDAHVISTGWRDIKLDFNEQEASTQENHYEITAARYEDHMKLTMISGKGKFTGIIALPDRSNSVYIGLTGERCHLSNITVTNTGETVGDGSIPRIMGEDTYINRFESDVPNVQIDRYRSDTTQAVPLKDRLRIKFHSMSLPSANLVWHCPYIVLFYSEDKKVYSESYREYAMIKINGEVSSDENISENNFSMKKLDSFPGWEVWKEKHKQGLECSVSFVRKGNKVTITTETLGIAINNETTILDGTKDLYVSISGDEVALTDIRVN